MGSLSSAIILCKLMGLPDPRTQGSGNPGATNVLRVGGKRAAIITLAGDMIKGVLPVLAGHAMGASLNVLAAIGFAAFLGHLYPVFFGFRGGKGVATAIGVLIATTWQVGLATIVTWMTMAYLFRISSLSALTAFALTPLYTWILIPGQPVYFGMVCIMTTLLLWRHRSNIRKLLQGTEK
jgi:glycerol-3-phosphate acyltransferase PlsY